MDSPNPMQPPDRRTARRVPMPGFAEFTLLVALMMGVTAFAVDAVLPAFPAMARSFQVANPNDLQLVVYVYMLGFGAASIVYGPASDIVGRRSAYLAGTAVFLAGSALTLFADDLSTLLVARFIQGTGAAAGRVLSTAIIRDRFSGRDMARVMSLNMTVFITVPIFAPAIGSLLLLVGDWHLLFTAMLLLGLATGAWFLLRMPETLADENRMGLSARRILDGAYATVSTRQTAGYGTAVGLLFGCVMALVGSSQQVFAESFGLGAWFPLAFGLLAASMGAASLVNAAAVRRHGMHRISHAGLLAFVALGLALAGIAIGWRGHPPLLVFGPVLAGAQFLLGLIFPNFNALAMDPVGRVAGTASSVLGLYTTVLGALCGAAIGRLFDGTVLPLALGYAALGLLSLVVVLVTERGTLFRTRHSGPTRSEAD